jgi:hypothetical protein
MILPSDIGSIVWYTGTDDKPHVEVPLQLISIVGDAAFLVDEHGVVYGVSTFRCAPNRPGLTLEPMDKRPRYW